MTTCASGQTNKKSVYRVDLRPRVEKEIDVQRRQRRTHHRRDRDADESAECRSGNHVTLWVRGA